MNLLSGFEIQHLLRKRISMVLPKHPQYEVSLRGPLLQGGDPAKTLWENPQMRGVDKVNPTSTVGKVFILSQFSKKHTY